MGSYIIHSYYSILLWGIAIATYAAAAVLYFSRGLGKDNKKEKVLFYGFAVYIVFNAITRALFLPYDFGFPTTWSNGFFYTDASSLTLNQEMIYRVINVTASLSLVSLMLGLEYYTGKTRFALTLAYSATTIAVALLPIDVSVLIAMIFTFPFNVVTFGLMLYIFTKWTRAEYKSLSAILYCGFINLGFGAFLEIDTTKMSNVFPVEIAPVFLIASGICFSIPLLIDPKHLSRPKALWNAVGAYSIATVVLFTVVAIVFTMPSDWILVGFMVILLFFIMYYSTLRIIKAEARYAKPADAPNVLEMFVRPQKLNEEEISISKEKKICLVCKGKLSRQIYICPGCGAFFCCKCADALSDHENMCWVCQQPFDEAKPSQPHDEAEKPEVTAGEHDGGKKAVKAQPLKGKDA